MTTNALLAQQLKVARIFSFLFPIIFLIANLGQALVLYFGGRQIIEWDADAGRVAKILAVLGYVFFPLGQLGFIINLMAQANASAQRIFEILDTKNDVEDKPGAKVDGGGTGDVVFADVVFRYFNGGEPVFNHVSFEANQGRRWRCSERRAAARRRLLT